MQNRARPPRLLSVGQLRLLPEDALGGVPLVLADEAHHHVEAQVAQAHAAGLRAVDLRCSIQLLTL